MRRYVDQAIAMRRVNYGEKDRIVTMLMKDHGKIALYARGARGQKSKTGPGIELLTLSEVTFVDGKGALKTLTSATIQRHYETVVTDLEKMSQAFEALKIIDKIADDNSGQEYFELLKCYFEALNSGTVFPLVAEIWFDLRILQVSGLLGEIKIVSEAQDGTVPQDRYLYDFEEQQFISHPDGVFGKNDIKLLRLLSTASRPVVLEHRHENEGALRALVKSIVEMNFSRG